MLTTGRGMLGGCFRCAPVIVLLAFLCAVGLPAQAGLQDIVGLWQLDNDLNNEVAGQAPLDASTFLATPAFTSASIVGETATVLDVPALTPNETLTVTNPVGPTSGGTYTNDWTIVMDVNFVSPLAAYASLLQTNTANGNDVDVFIRGSNNGIDIGGATVGAGTFFADTWYRLAVTGRGNPAAGTVTTAAYADGVFLGSTDNNGFDGTMTLEDVFHLFSDNDNDTSRTQVNSIGYWGEALRSAEVSALGAATAAGIDPTVSVPAFLLTVDRDTGEITLANQSGTALMTQGYSVLSESGSLNSDQWASIAETADSDSGGSFDSMNRWIRFTADGARGDLSEGVFGTTTIASGTSHSFGMGVWIPYPSEALSFTLLDENGEEVEGLIEFVGNGGEAVQFLDLNFDGAIDGQDWLVYAEGLGSEFPSLSVAEAYAQGDLNGDLVNDYRDFVIFQSTYDQLFGAGAFDEMVQSVPEPAGGLILISGAWCLFCTVRRR